MTSQGSSTDRITEQPGKEARAYARHHDRPLGSYLVIGGAYGVAVAGIAAFATVTGRRLPEQFRWADLGLLAVAPRKISRLLTKDPVTSPLRGPVYPLFGYQRGGRACRGGTR